MLTLTVKNDNEAICLSSDQISFTDPDLTKVTITSIINCCNTSEYTGELTQFSSDACWYNLQTDLELGGFSYNYITEFTVALNGVEKNFVVSPTEYQILVAGVKSAFMSALEAMVNTWLVNNNVDSTFTISFTDGIGTNSVILLQFDGFVPGLVPQTVTFKNVGTDTTQLTFSDCIEDTSVSNSCLIVDGELCVQPCFYSQTGTLSDGIYGVTIEAEYEDGSIITEQACAFVSPIIKCKIPGLIADGDYDAHMLYEGIIKSVECTTVDCDCEIACGLLSMLVEKLNQKLITDGSIAECGCS